jgi:hypothetical protein
MTFLVLTCAKFMAVKVEIYVRKFADFTVINLAKLVKFHNTPNLTDIYKGKDMNKHADRHIETDK